MNDKLKLLLDKNFLLILLLYFTTPIMLGYILSRTIDIVSKLDNVVYMWSMIVTYIIIFYTSMMLLIKNNLKLLYVFLVALFMLMLILDLLMFKENVL